MPTAFADDLTARIARFLGGLDGVGVAVSPADLGDEPTFLPGIRLDAGSLLVDEARLDHPGDLLHEAAHVALVAPALRHHLTGEAAVPGLDMGELERGALPWSYAAALAAGVDPAEVFHGAGYHGHSAGLLATFKLGVYPGAPLLDALGLTAVGARAAELGVEPYPHMLRWLRE